MFGSKLMISYTYNADFVICIDATYRMAPIIELVKRHAHQVCVSFIDRMEETCRELSEFRVKIIVFREYGSEGEPMVETSFFTLPDEREELESFVCSIEAKGGSGGPANALEAIALAIKSDWTAESTKKRHVILVYSNAAALPLSERTGSPSYPEGIPADMNALNAWWEGEDPSFRGTYRSRAGRIIAIVPEETPWTEMLSWNRCFLVPIGNISPDQTLADVEQIAIVAACAY